MESFDEFSAADRNSVESADDLEPGAYPSSNSLFSTVDESNLGAVVPWPSSHDLVPLLYDFVHRAMSIANPLSFSASPFAQTPAHHCPQQTAVQPEDEPEYVRRENAVVELYHNEVENHFDFDGRKYEKGSIWIWTGQYPNNIYRRFGTLVRPRYAVKRFPFWHRLPKEVIILILDFCITMPKNRLDFVVRLDEKQAGGAERVACKQLRAANPGRQELIEEVERAQKADNRQIVLRALALMSVNRPIRNYCLERFWRNNEMSFEHLAMATKLINILGKTAGMIKTVSFHHHYHRAPAKLFFNTAATSLTGLEEVIFQPTINVDNCFIKASAKDFAKRAVNFLSLPRVVGKGKDKGREITECEVLKISPEYAQQYPDMKLFLQEVQNYLPAAKLLEEKAEKRRQKKEKTRGCWGRYRWPSLIALRR